MFDSREATGPIGWPPPCTALKGDWSSRHHAEASVDNGIMPERAMTDLTSVFL